MILDPENKSFSFKDFEGNTIASDGATLAINGTADFAVAFNDLKTGFDQLKSDLNTFIGTYNTHTHPTAATGPPSLPSAEGTSSGASIDGSKVDSVKFP